MVDQNGKNKNERIREGLSREKGEDQERKSEEEHSPEQGFERGKETSTQEKRDEISGQLAEEAEGGGEEKASGALPQREARQKEVENILENDLRELYEGLPPDKKKEFKIKGEETAKKINETLDKAKVKAKKIVDLIKKWLSILPGVNKFFIEQEAKIKADEIIKLKDKDR